MKIGRKLTLAFASFVVFFAVIGVIAVLNLQNLSHLAEDSYQRITQPLGILLEMAVGHQKIRVLIRDSILHADPVKIRKDVTDITDLNTQIDSLTAEYAKTIISDEGRILFSDYRTAATNYRTEMAHVLGLAGQNKNPEALALLDGRLVPIANTLQKSIDALVGSKNKAQLQRLDQTQSQTKQTSLEMVLIILGTAVVALGLGMFFRHNLTMPIIGATSIASRFAEGKYEDAVPGALQQRKDEVGLIGQALEALRLALASRARDTWINEDVTAVSRKLQTLEDMASFSDCLLREIHRITNVPYQAMYLHDARTKRLVRQANAGGTAMFGDSWAPGEGLAGECFMLKKPMALDCPVDHPVGLPTGIGILPLTTLYAWPIDSTNHQLGVVELGSLKALGERELLWIEALLPLLALNLEILDRNLRTKELLAQTQEQSEDMMLQAAQLEEQTAELEAQQAAIKETEAWYRGIIESAPDGMLVTNEEGRIILANPQVDAIFGFEPGTLTGRFIEALVPELSRGKHVGLRDAFMREGKARGMGHARKELRGVSQDGREFPVEVSLSVLPAVGVQGVCVCASVRDISERRAAEIRLASAEARSRLILGSVGDGIFGLDAAGIVTFVNPAVERILGFTEEELVGKSMHDMVHHHHADGSVFPGETCPMRFTLKDGQPRTIDDEVLWTKDGRSIPVEYSTSPIMQEGVIAGAVVTFKDIRERIEAAQLVVAEQQRLQSILDRSPIAVATLIGGHIRFANPRFADLFDISIGDPIPDIWVHPAERSKVYGLLAKDGVVQDFEASLYGKNREVRDMLITMMPLVENGEQGVLGWIQDITQRKTAERILQDSERQHRIVFENSPLGMIYFNVEGIIVDCNGKFVDLMGSTREKLIGFNTAQDSSPKMSAALKLALSGEPAVYEDPYTSATAGKTIFLRVIFNPVNPGISPTEVIATLEDITDQKQIEQAVAVERERLQSILDKSPVSVSITGVQSGIILYANEVALAIFGSKVGQKVAQVYVNPTNREEVLQLLQTQGAVRDFEYQVYDREGTIRDMLLTAIVIDYNGEPGLLVWQMDITERKRQETTIKKSEMRLNLAAESGGIAIWEWTIPTDVTIANSMYAEVFGFDPAKVPVSVTWQERMHPDDKEASTQSLMDHLAGKSEMYRAEFRFFHPALNDYVWLNSQAKVTEYAADGSPQVVIGITTDITGRKKAAEAIASERHRLQDILDKCPIGIAMVVKGHLRFGNPEFFETLGGELGRDLTGVWVHPEERDEMYAALAKSGAVENLEIEMYNRQHEARHMIVTFMPMDVEGESGILGWIQDITERKQSEIEILRQRGMMLGLIQSIPDLVFYKNIDGMYMGCNSAYASLLGKAKAEILDSTDFDLYPADIAKEHLESDREIIAHDKPFSMENWETYPDGRKVLFQTLKTALRSEDGKIIGVLGVSRDITEAHNLQTEIEEAKVNLDIALTSAKMGAWKYYVQENRIDGDTNTIRLYGLDDVEMTGDIGQWFTYVHPDDAAELGRVMQETMASRSPDYKATFRVVRPDRETLHIMSIGKFQYAEDGTPLMASGLVWDVSDIKKIEADLNRAKETAEEATKLKSDFLANMSHEIRTPMNAIIGMSHLVLKTELNTRQRDYLQKIQQSGQHLLGVINDILDFSKVEAGKLTVEKVDFELQKVMDNVTSLIAEKTSSKGLEFLINVAPDVPPFLIGDSLRVGQVLINYANNAVKFTEKGEIELQVSVLERGEDEVFLRFGVRDTGIGLTPEQISRLFQSFQQADSSTTRKYGGTGLGLAISKSLSELMGGSVGVDSVHGQGSTFWFTGRFGIGAAQSHKNVPVPDLRGRRVLVVDDNDKARLILRDMLESLTFEVEEAGSGVAAIKLVQEGVSQGKPFEVVFMDWNMPGMDGIESSKAIMGLGLNPAPHLMMVTAYGREEVMRAADQIGIEQVLIKPVGASLLFDAVIRVLGVNRAAELQGRSVEAGQDLADLHGIHILVVEDNEMNQIVARDLLEDAGVRVDMAENGQIAVDWLASNTCDLVLMDMQMPVMDGMTATKILRANPRLDTLPILAMTANAMQQDREASLAVGMNDHIAKPIDPDQLFAAIRKWAKPVVQATGLATVTVVAGPVPAPSVEGLPPLPGIDANAGLKRVRGKIPLYKDLLERFADGQAGAAESLQSALAAGDRDGARRTAHTVKGLAATLGADKLAKLAGILEAALQKESELPTGSLENFTLELAATVVVISSAFCLRPTTDGCADDETSAVDPVALAASLAKLRQLLSDGDSSVLDHLEADHTLLACGLGAKTCQAILKAVKDYDFDLALENLPK